MGHKQGMHIVCAQFLLLCFVTASKAVHLHASQLRPSCSFGAWLCCGKREFSEAQTQSPRRLVGTTLSLSGTHVRVPEVEEEQRDGQTGGTTPAPPACGQHI